MRPILAAAAVLACSSTLTVGCGDDTQSLVSDANIGAPMDAPVDARGPVDAPDAPNWLQCEGPDAACNIFFHDCADGLKCTFMPNDVCRHTGCTLPGDAGLGQACTGSGFGDDCASGLVCVGQT